MNPYKQTHLAILENGEIAEVMRDDTGYVAGRWRTRDTWSGWSLIAGPGAVDVSVTPAGPDRVFVSVLDKREADPPIGARTVYELTASGCRALDL
jgi:hypothetical protein